MWICSLCKNIISNLDFYQHFSRPRYNLLTCMPTKKLKSSEIITHKKCMYRKKNLNLNSKFRWWNHFLHSVSLHLQTMSIKQKRYAPKTKEILVMIWFLCNFIILFPCFTSVENQFQRVPTKSIHKSNHETTFLIETESYIYLVSFHFHLLL